MLRDTPTDRYCTVRWSVYSQFLETKAPTVLIRNKDNKQWSSVSPYIPPFEHSTPLGSAHTLYSCVLCRSENKQRLFHYTALTDWFLQPRRSVFTARYGLNIYIYYRLISVLKFLIQNCNIFSVSDRTDTAMHGDTQLIQLHSLK
jgi:hypothetical protein